MKKLVFVSGAVLSVLLMFSCSTTGTVWDESVPPERSAKILFNYYKPKSYNGITFNKRNFTIVTLPAGDAAFIGDISWGNVSYSFSAKNAAFSCKLEGGKEYWAVVSFEYNKDAKRRIWGIRLYNDVIKLRVGFPPEDKLLGFIPFDPPVISN
jgi:hypothetical protein